MAYRDLRQWLDVLRENGELIEVTQEVDWNLEVGAITRRVYETLSPAPLFTNIKGYPNYRILAAPLGYSARNSHARLALALDLPADTPLKMIVEEYLSRRRNHIPPNIVSDAPCQENVHLGDDINVLEFPVSLQHEDDGGRYIGTWHTTITKDPSTGWVNYGMYRLMVHDRNHLGGLISTAQHFNMHLSAYKERGQRMEFAIAIGAEPVTAIMSATTLPEFVSEAEVIGGLRGEPLEVTKCKTVDLYVPATAEIVLEGYVDPNEMRDEGPFGEYTGYFGGGKLPRAVYNITAITHRNDPILTMSCPGIPPDDSVMHVTMGAELLRELREHYGMPVEFVYFPPEGAAHLCVISTKVPDSTYVNRLAMAVWSTKTGRLFCNSLIVVNDDIDPTDMQRVIWAWTTRMHPNRGIWQVPNTFTSALLPFPTPEERAKRIGGRVLYDATWPADWPKDWIPKVSSFETAWPREIQERVLNQWQTYGFK